MNLTDIQKFKNFHFKAKTSINQEENLEMFINRSKNNTNQVLASESDQMIK